MFSSGEVVLARRVPTAFYNIFLALSRAHRLLFWPRNVTQTEIEDIDGDIKYFVSNFYAEIYRGTAEGLPLCLSTIAYPLEEVPPIWACGPAWVVWQFAIERKNEALRKLNGSVSRPHANVLRSKTMQCTSEWADTSGKPSTPAGIPAESLTVPQSIGPDCVLLHRRSASAAIN